MENIYNDSVKMVADGAVFKVNFETRSLSIGNKLIIKNGNYDGCLGFEAMPMDNVIAKLEYLYSIYKHSVPSERSENKRRKYFTALPEESLTDDDMMYGELRDVAQFELELFVLCCIITGSFEFAEGQWFWQSTNDKDLVILKKWFN